jgi:osmotically-inducible protein OsmY
MKPSRFLSLLVLPTVLVSTAIASEKPMPDDAIRIYVAATLTERIRGGGAIVVDVTNGVVTLTGKLPTKKQKAQAEKIAKNAPGAKSVMDLITVTNP